MNVLPPTTIARAVELEETGALRRGAGCANAATGRPYPSAALFFSSPCRPCSVASLLRSNGMSVGFKYRFFYRELFAFGKEVSSGIWPLPSRQENIFGQDSRIKLLTRHVILRT